MKHCKHFYSWCRPCNYYPWLEFLPHKYLTMLLEDMEECMEKTDLYSPILFIQEFLSYKCLIIAVVVYFRCDGCNKQKYKLCNSDSALLCKQVTVFVFRKLPSQLCSATLPLQSRYLFSHSLRQNLVLMLLQARYESANSFI